jgi:AbrB family looped-hinge helix DNA binding protein
MPLETAVFVTEKGQVTIPKGIRMAAGLVPGSEVVFRVEGSNIAITPVATAVKGDRRLQLRAAVARVRDSFSEEFKQMGADEIMNFIRGDGPAPSATRPGRR